MKPSGLPVICIDFDGVLHSYTSGWQGPRCIPDPPVEGALEWLCGLLDSVRINVAIYSSRSKYIGGRRAMKAWFRKCGIGDIDLKQLWFPLFKPPALITIDDRALTFTGSFPPLRDMLRFKPWNKDDMFRAPMSYTDAQILNELTVALNNLGAVPMELLGAVGSWKDTLSDEDVLFLLQAWNEDHPSETLIPPYES